MSAPEHRNIESKSRETNLEHIVAKLNQVPPDVADEQRQSITSV